jgi:hypothetical protein
MIELSWGQRETQKERNFLLRSPRLDPLSLGETAKKNLVDVLCAFISITVFVASSLWAGKKSYPDLLFLHLFTAIRAY